MTSDVVAREFALRVAIREAKEQTRLKCEANFCPHFEHLGMLLGAKINNTIAFTKSQLRLKCEAKLCLPTAPLLLHHCLPGLLRAPLHKHFQLYWSPTGGPRRAIAAGQCDISTFQCTTSTLAAVTLLEILTKDGTAVESFWLLRQRQHRVRG